MYLSCLERASSENIDQVNGNSWDTPHHPRAKLYTLRRTSKNDIVSQRNGDKSVWNIALARGSLTLPGGQMDPIFIIFEPAGCYSDPLTPTYKWKFVSRTRDVQCPESQIVDAGHRLVPKTDLQKYDKQDSTTFEITRLTRLWRLNSFLAPSDLTSLEEKSENRTRREKIRERLRWSGRSGTK